MQRQAVKSSNVKEIGYEDVAEILEVQFHSGAIWNYCPVPRATYEAMLDPTNSVGRILNEIKRDPNIAAERIDTAEAEAAS
jgi:hypothetical protein